MPTAEITDPYMIYDTPRNGGTPYARYARADRAIWRDLDALLLQDTGSGRTRRPAVFGNLPDSGVTGKLRVRAIGFDQEGQASDRQWFTASTPPILSACDTEEGATVYDNAAEIHDAHEAAERVADDLKKALQRAWSALSDPSGGQGKARSHVNDGPWLAAGLGRYWPAAETVFWNMVNHPGGLDYPNNTFIRLAARAYDAATDDHATRSPRVARALERARSGIYATWSKVQPSPMEVTDV